MPRATKKSNCAACDRENAADNMVQCDQCEKWYHFDCANVSWSIKDEKWSCKRCVGNTVMDRKVKKADSETMVATDSKPRRSGDLEPTGRAKSEAAYNVGDRKSVRKFTSVEHRNGTDRAFSFITTKRDTTERESLKSASMKSSSSSHREELEKFVREQNQTMKRLLEEKDKMVNEHLKLQADMQKKMVALVAKCSAAKSKSGSVCGSDSSFISGRTKSAEWVSNQRDFFPQANSSREERDEHRRMQSNAVQPRCNGLLKPTAEQIAARQAWPKKLPAFDGSPRDWPRFYNIFVESTTACGISNAENLARLEECLSGAARDVVEGWFDAPSSVPLIIKTLQRLFGKPSLIVKDMLKKIRQVPAPGPERLDELITFGLAVQHLCNQLNSVDRQHYLSNQELLEELVEKLPASRRLEWVTYKRILKEENQKEATLKEFGLFMEDLVEKASEVTEYVPPKVNQPRSNQRHVHLHMPGGSGSNETATKDVEKTSSSKSPSAPYARLPTNTQAGMFKQVVDCLVCNNPTHRIKHCEEFKRMTVENRLATVKKFKLCYNCLGNHGDKPCKSRYSCKIAGCRERHHSLLHGMPNNPATTVAECNAHQVKERSIETLFRIVPVSVHNGSISIDTLAFLDEGSSVTLVETTLANRLGLTGVLEPLALRWTSDVKRMEPTSHRVSLEISAKGEERRYSIAAAHTINRLSLPTYNQNCHTLIRNLYYLQDVPLHTLNDPVPQLLIGLADAELLKPLETRSGPPGEPIAVRSALGWAVYGPCSTSVGANRQSAFLNVHHSVADDQMLNETMRKYFALEESAINTFNKFLPEPESLKRAKATLANTTSKSNGRYTTGLLWKSDVICFPDSKPMALARLRALERKLERNPELKRNVHDQMRMYMQLGYAHKATASELNPAQHKRIWYLPLNVVGHPRKPNKKRLVWDAAAKVDGISLNSQLLKGPDLLIELPAVLCKFRQKKVAFGGDIEKMFHQIRIREEDTHSQRFFFRFSQNNPPEVYIMDVATFGASCSPCSAQYVMHRNADEHATEYPKAAAAIKTKTYMDDYYDSCDSIDEAMEIARQVKHIHAQAGFNMRNWVSNDSTLLRSLEESTSDKKVEINLGQEGKHPRVLGITWDPLTDVFKFSANWHEELKPYVIGREKPTKRIVLRIIMSLFDPLGLVAPILIHGRMMMQDLWRDNLGWDDQLNEIQFNKFLRWTDLLPKIHSLEIPRWYFKGSSSNTCKSLQLHIFTDASELGYGCAAYFRLETTNGIQCALVMARSKVAPLQHLTIPKLELQAALLGARLKRTVCESHDLVINNTYFHTDSEVALSWIRTPTHELKQFVACRVGEILSLSDPKEWRHVPTSENPADCLTKWCKDTEIDPQGRWLNGPAFLYLPENSWPTQKAIKATKEERKTCYLAHHSTLNHPLVDVSRFSRWKLLLRTVAIIFRFASNCKRKAQGLPIQALKATKKQIATIKNALAAEHKPISTEEYQRAERFLWRTAQTDTYPKEVQLLTKPSNVEKLPCLEPSSPLHNLIPFADEYGILRVDGRSSKTDSIPYDTRYPIILPKMHDITTLILKDYHERFGHANCETVVNEVRQRYYVEHLRSSIARTTRACQRCKIRKTKPVYPRMAPLPEGRLTPHIRPFCKVGVDYLGPIDVINARRKEKRYVAVFTCLVTRAVHLEVAHSLSTETCIMVIRRFVSRRGAPSEIFSDNGTNFVGASNELVKQISNANYASAETFTDAHTKWIFNPPSAPHMGGVWERMVRSVKEAMQALDDGRKLNDEILLTTLAETESLINSRPLTYMPQNPSNIEAITPNHFLLGSSCGKKEQLRESPDLAKTLRSSYQRATALTAAMWDRWLKEYLPEVNLRSKWRRDVDNLSVGDLVFIAEGPRKNWLRAKVETVIPGRDGRVRQAIVRTANGKQLKRPVVKLAVLKVEV